MKKQSLTNESGMSFEYVPFSTRLFAATIDLIIITILITPVANFMSYFFYDGKTVQIMVDEFLSVERQDVSAWDFFLFMMDNIKAGFILIHIVVFVLIASILLWSWKRYNASIGKMIMRCKIIDEKTGGNPSTKQYILRLLGYALSCIPPFIGFLIMGLNKKSRGLQDYIAGTSVVYNEKGGSGLHIDIKPRS